MTTWFLTLLLGLLIGGWSVARWQQRRRGRQDRRQVEDALKHLFDQEYRGRHASLASLAGALNLAEGRVVALIGRMATQNLVHVRGQEFDLTPDGEKLALQIVRAHRLLERYFADEARLPLGQIHAAAERQEHALSTADVERLSASLGHPTVDPHGDPIPSREGEVPPAAGTPVTAWPIDVNGRIVHLEDEPQISFAQILAEGLHIGQVVHLIEVTPQRVVLTDGENEYRLAPAVAANVFLAPAPAEAIDTAIVRLSDLAHDERAEIVGLDDRCQGFSRRRLMDLGFTEGARIRPILRTFAGDPRAYEVRGTVVALRRDQASQVLVRRAAVSERGAA
jgi:DtxR family transcriptional regulator, Mn-dependent transcriptional regulator